jgi:hypothetical protein
VASVGAFSITATGLTAGTTYHLRAKAVGPIGGTVYGSDVTYVHSASGSLGVSTGSGTYATSTSAVLGGTLTGLGTDSSASCSIEYGPTTSYGSTTSATTLSVAGSFTGGATGLVSGQTYHFRARATGSPSGSTVYGSDATYTHSGGCGSDPVGCTAGSRDYYIAKNVPIWTRYAATSTTNITKINVICSGSGTAKVAIYSDSSGSLGTLMQHGSNAVVAGLNSVTITSTPITTGTYYWLGVWANASVFQLTGDTGATYAYGNTDPAFAFPSTAPAYLYYGTAIRGLISGTN